MSQTYEEKVAEYADSKREYIVDCLQNAKDEYKYHRTEYNIAAKYKKQYLIQIGTAPTLERADLEQQLEYAREGVKFHRKQYIEASYYKRLLKDALDYYDRRHN